jgi:IS30 family transposase
VLQATSRDVSVQNKIKDIKLLDQRPAKVGEWRVPGRWEGDLVIGADRSDMLPQQSAEAATCCTSQRRHSCGRPGPTPRGC